MKLKKKRIFLLFLVLGILACGIGFFVVQPQGWLAFESQQQVEPMPQQAEPPSLTLPPAPKKAEEEPEAEAENIVRGTVAAGETLGEVLAASANDAPTQHYVRAAKEVFSVRSFRTGHPYTVVTDPETGRLSRFEYEIDEHKRLVVEGLDEPVARVEQIEYSYSLSLVQCVIDDNMFQAVADAGEQPQLALAVANIFGSEINFIHDLQKGDSFSVLVEKRYRDGLYKGYGRVLGAVFINKGKKFQGFLFTDAQGRAKHFNAQGENLTKVLMQVPLSFTRVSSGFGMRRHPVLGGHRDHPGIDYAAPMGTPVKAAGDGVVVDKGRNGGYGNQIVLRHDAGLETLYSHLSGYARGLNKGARVRQGQVIGYVGSTGMSTGPHLDFRVRQQGKFINPTKAVNPRAMAVAAKRKQAFTKVVHFVLAFMQGERDVHEYSPEMFTAYLE
ncbi:MAG: M23 family metallopeptidase [Desulfovibrionaceae bacterium]|nr:M23 family metallopeptidase [Desulfovibrionaceae bacterium]